MTGSTLKSLCPSPDCDRIDFSRERPISLVDLAELLGRPARSIYRWAHTGIRGVKLETAPVGDQLYTTREALQRFSLAYAEKKSCAIERHSAPLSAMEGHLDIPFANGLYF